MKNKEITQKDLEKAIKDFSGINLRELDEQKEVEKEEKVTQKDLQKAIKKFCGRTLER